MSDRDLAALESLREAVQAVVNRMASREVDHRHPEEEGAAAPFALGRAYYYAGDIIDDICDLRTALTEGAHQDEPDQRFAGGSDA